MAPKSADFRTITDVPLNGSPAPEALARNHITPVADFFVRNHGEVPGGRSEVRTGGFQLVRVTGLVKYPMTLPASATTLSPLKRMSIQATLQCAGNRRHGFTRVKPIEGELPWTSEAIGNATWDGYALASILRQAVVADDAAHVWFLGADAAMGKQAGTRFGASIPIEKALSGDVLIADTMNGEALTPDHGAPQRAIVPGYIGARSVKWLTEIRVEREPTPNPFQNAYALLFPGPAAPAPEPVVLSTFPTSSAFAISAKTLTPNPGPLRLRGWAIAHHDHVIERVEVSVDGGTSWTDARLLSPPQRFVWRLWEADVTLPPGDHELVCRATDNGGNTQPPDAESVWNTKGYVNDSWDRVRVTVGN